MEKYFSKKIFLIFCMKLGTIVGHKMTLAAISRKFLFFHNGGIYSVKMTFSVIINQPCGRIGLFSSRRQQIIKEKYFSNLFHKFLIISGLYGPRHAQIRPQNGQKSSFSQFFLKTLNQICLIFCMKLGTIVGHKMTLAAIFQEL